MNLGSAGACGALRGAVAAALALLALALVPGTARADDGTPATPVTASPAPAQPPAPAAPVAAAPDAVPSAPPASDPPLVEPADAAVASDPAATVASPPPSPAPATPPAATSAEPAVATASAEPAVGTAPPPPANDAAAPPASVSALTATPVAAPPPPPPSPEPPPPPIETVVTVPPLTAAADVTAAEPALTIEAGPDVLTRGAWQPPDAAVVAAAPVPDVAARALKARRAHSGLAVAPRDRTRSFAPATAPLSARPGAIVPRARAVAVHVRPAPFAPGRRALCASRATSEKHSAHAGVESPVEAVNAVPRSLHDDPMARGGDHPAGAGTASGSSTSGGVIVPATLDVRPPDARSSFAHSSAKRRRVLARRGRGRPG